MNLADWLLAAAGVFALFKIGDALYEVADVLKIIVAQNDEAEHDHR
jgi:hypothetical protein